MEYKGNLYGKVGKTYFPLEKTTEDWDELEAKASLNKANELSQDDDSGSHPTQSELINMKLHERINLEHVHILRVVGGWIYNFTFATSESRDLEAFENHVFVPEPLFKTK